MYIYMYNQFNMIQYNYLLSMHSPQEYVDPLYHPLLSNGCQTWTHEQTRLVYEAIYTQPYQHIPGSIGITKQREQEQRAQFLIKFYKEQSLNCPLEQYDIFEDGIATKRIREERTTDQTQQGDHSMANPASQKNQNEEIDIFQSESESGSEGSYTPTDIPTRKPPYKKRKGKSDIYQRNSHAHLCTCFKQCFIDLGVSQELFQEILNGGTKRRLEVILRRPQLQEILAYLFNQMDSLIKKIHKAKSKQKQFDENLLRKYKKKFESGSFIR